MAQITEAAGLLHSGVMYPERAGLRTESGVDVLLGLKPGGLSLYFGDSPIYHFDLEGRWQRAFMAGLHYLKGLDGSVRSVDRGRDGPSMVLRRTVIDPAEVDRLDESIRSDAAGLAASMRSGRIEILPPPPPARPLGVAGWAEILGRVAAWDGPAWAGHRARYAATYGPWPLLPPDCPNPIVLQATATPPFGSIRPGSGRALSPDEFRRHAGEVAALLGRRSGQCRDVFVAGGDWLRSPTEVVLSHLGTVGEVFPPSARPGSSEVRAFLDDFRPPLPGPEGWRRLRESGLGRLTLGVESGDPSIRAAYGKTWEDDDFRSALRAIRGAGIGVGLVALVGLGGRHGESTARFLGSLPPRDAELVTLVDAGDLDGGPGPGPSMKPDETSVQVAAIRRALAGSGASKGPRVVTYNPAKQWA